MTVVRRVSVERNRLRFAAAHFATFRGTCEPLHGHNYDVRVELEGELTDDSWVWDFGELKKLTKRLIDELDHRFILQRESRVLDIVEHGDSFEVSFEGRRYVFPREDVASLPIDNSTVERISEWLAERIGDELKALDVRNVRSLTVAVEEMPGQAGWYTVQL